MKRWILFFLALALLCQTAASVCAGPLEKGTDISNSSVIDDENQTQSTEDFVLLNEKQQALFDRSYQTLVNRVDDRGFAPTSLDGGVFVDLGMFTRDSFTQALAHIANEDYDLARRILRYQLSYHVNAGYETIVRFVPNLQDDEYGNSCGTQGELTGLAELGGSRQAVQQICTFTELITGVKVYLSKTDAAKGSLTAVLSKSRSDDSSYERSQHIDTQQIPVENIAAEGGWVTILFQLPLEKTADGIDYFLTLQANDSPEGSVIWHGVQSDEMSSLLIQDGKPAEIDGELSYNALRSTLGSKLESENFPQGDCNSQLALAWALFAKEAPRTEENLRFIQESYPLVKQYALYYVFAKDAEGEAYWNEEMSLLREPCLEHSRAHVELLPVINSSYNGYNLWSSVFASQAFYEMAPVALALGDKEGAEIFRQYDQKMVQGVHEHLTTDYDGLTIYAELIDADHDNRFIPGFSWVNLTPAAVSWHAVDWEIMGNTIELYLKYGSNRIKNRIVPDSTVTLADGKGSKSGLTYAETIAATAMYYYYGAGDVASAQSMLDTAALLAGDIYFETVNVFGQKTDPGNQMHCAWLCLAVTKLTGPQKDTELSFLSEEIDISLLPVRVKKGDSFPLPSPARPLYRLQSWTCGGREYAPGESIVADQDMTFTAVWEKSGRYGDVNYDGKIDPADALLVLQHVVDIRTLTETEAAAADVNKDNAMDPNDALLILQHSVDLIDTFPAEEESNV